MNLLEFKRRLMTDPDSNDPDMVEARRTHPEQAADSDHFEAQLKSALDVTPPEDLVARIRSIPDRAEPVSRRPGWRWPVSLAATLALGMLLGVILFRSASGPAIPLGDYLAEHWAHDGRPALEAMQTSVPETELDAVMQTLDFSLGETTRQQVRFVKLCPAPDGAGAHLVLATEAGPVTVFYLPGLQARGESDLAVDGMRAWVADLETGAITVIAPPGTDGATIMEKFMAQFRAGRDNI